MAWNEPGNKGKDPWGNKNSNDKGPPDLDEVFRNLSKRFGGGKGGSGGSSSPSFNPMSLIVVLVIGLIIWGGSGFYTIKEAERGVTLRFGQHSGEVGPGLHWKATFIDEVFPVNIKAVRSIPASGSMLTADENLVKVELDVQYRVDDAYSYLFSAVDANESLSEATDSALRYVIGHNTMDDILTTGRDAIRRDTWAELERILEPYKLGLSIQDVNFLPARPPEEVKDAFDDAISAQEDEQRFIREAEAYAREIEPKARGQVERMAQQASAYKQREVLEAQGKVARFEKLLPEYQMAPEVTRKRLYLNAMQEVMADTNKVLIDTKNNGNLMYLPLDKMMGNQAKTMPAEPVVETHVNTPSNNSLTSSMPVDGRQTRESRSRQGRD
ncbi:MULTISPECIES: FtsH protease activity modulator HflK [unclassified Shewanella]|uniref:FtsH protease activity modulator HflK n=1 Tax=unclassified Shewanella TaxID=196818 RepID=UPI000C85F2C2|nr:MULTISPECIES: FtsH protease activity modulator HflK [unclassified Shewanella]MDO6618062.1 FtsH protease activity modulator HflK [Shewanella sp. 6_MG-2023]MDO6640953.1 FtsH protease activity modulator HflK [Shewanella sp. 5_MG-2023]MDO6679221.1 FtsH protease activity modulator HflK [Shewanella sp. 4_MG-2023]MDO6776522.1 FtsH protease activity modulator HflK [Shewanella sp. 3_MG-2023]PMG30688.1 HflK protein [Shewanella sp. 10N.286.52.C2]